MADEKIIPKEQEDLSDTEEEEDTETSPEKDQMKPVSFAYSKSYCRTQFESDVFDYVWKFDRWSRLSKAADEFISSPFPKTAHYKIKMEILHASDWEESIVKFFINTKTSFRGSCDVYTIQADNKVLHNSIWGCISDMTLLLETTTKLLSQYSDKDTVEMGFIFEIFQQILTNNLDLEPLPSPVVCLKDKKFADLTRCISEFHDTESITFIINEERYNISKKLLNHKSNCLANFSLANYFHNICIKDKTGLIEVKNNNMQEAFKIMLSFIKTGLMPVSIDYYTLTKLLKLAVKCEVKDLKLLCEQYLMHTITMYTVIELTLLAFTYNADCLLKHLTGFIKFHIREILLTREFQLLSQVEANKIIVLVEEDEISEESKFIT